MWRVQNAARVICVKVVDIHSRILSYLTFATGRDVQALRAVVTQVAKESTPPSHESRTCIVMIMLC